MDRVAGDWSDDERSKKAGPRRRGIGRVWSEPRIAHGHRVFRRFALPDGTGPHWKTAKSKYQKPKALLKRTCERVVPLLLGVLHVVLLQLAIESGLSDAEHASRRKFVAPRFAKSAENRAPLQFLERQNFIFLRRPFGGGILQVGGQV